MDVHAENEERASQLLQLFDDVLVAFTGGNDLVDPTGKRMRASSRDLQTGALGSSDQLAARAVHLDAQLANVLANFRTCLHDGLMHFVFDLFDDVRGGGGYELHHVRAKLARGGIDNLEFFFYADSKAVSHEMALRVPGL